MKKSIISIIFVVSLMSLSSCSCCFPNFQKPEIKLEKSNIPGYTYEVNKYYEGEKEIKALDSSFILVTGPIKESLGRIKFSERSKGKDIFEEDILRIYLSGKDSTILKSNSYSYDKMGIKRSQNAMDMIVFCDIDTSGIAIMDVVETDYDPSNKLFWRAILTFAFLMVAGIFFALSLFKNKFWFIYIVAFLSFLFLAVSEWSIIAFSCLGIYAMIFMCVKWSYKKKYSSNVYKIYPPLFIFSFAGIPVIYLYMKVYFINGFIVFLGSVIITILFYKVIIAINKIIFYTKKGREVHKSSI